MQTEIERAKRRVVLAHKLARAEPERLRCEPLVPVGDDDDRRVDAAIADIVKDRERVDTGVAVFDQQNVVSERIVRRSGATSRAERSITTDRRRKLNRSTWSSKAFARERGDSDVQKS